MKNIIFFIFFSFLLNCKSAYQLADDDKEAKYLIKYIREKKNKGLITKRPLLVLNGQVIAYDSLSKCNMILFRKDIDSIYAFFKKK